MTRAECLDEAKQCVCTDRSQQYGEIENNFALISKLWTAYITARSAETITGYDVAAMMVLLKVARIATADAPKDDSWIDIAGYAACGAEYGSDRVCTDYNGEGETQ